MPFTTTYKWGDVLLLDIPLTDGTGKIKRPGFVLYDEGDDDVMVARITTHPSRSKSDVAIIDWKIIAPSVIRLSKVSTVKKTLIDKMLGSIESNEAQSLKNEWRGLF